MIDWLAAHPYADFAVIVIAYAVVSAMGSPRLRSLREQRNARGEPHEYVAPSCGPRCCRECVVCGREH